MGSNVMSQLPKGFVLDSSKSSDMLPKGFVVDQEEDPNLLQFANKGLIRGVTSIGDILRPATDFITKPVLDAMGINYSDNVPTLGDTLNQVAARQNISTTEKGDTLAERLAEGTGEAAGALATGGVLGKTIAGGTGAASQATRTAMEQFAKRPVSNVAAELAGGGAAQAAMGEAEDRGYDDPVSQFLAGMVGGVGAGLSTGAAAGVTRNAPTAVGGRMAGKFVQRHLMPRGRQTGARQIARDIIVGTTGKNADEVEAILSKSGMSELTPSELIGDESLMRFQANIARFDPEFARAIQLRHEAIDSGARKAIKDMSEGASPETFRDYLTGEVDTMRTSSGQQLDADIAEAQKIANKRVSEMGPRIDPAKRGNIVYTLLNKARKKSEAREARLWRAVPQNVRVPHNQTFDTMQRLQKRGEYAVREIPAELRKDFRSPQLDDAGEIINAGGIFGDVDAPRKAKDLLTLRSKLLRIMRREEAKPEGPGQLWDAANELQQAVSRDLDLGLGKYDAYRAASDYTRMQKDKFTKGAVGRILRADNARDPGRSLELTVGRADQAGRISAGEIRNILDEQGLLGKGDSGLGHKAISDFILEKFKELEGRPKSRVKFVKSNKNVLRDYPEIRKQLEEVIAAESGLAELQKASGPSALQRAVDATPEGRLVKARYNEEMNRILKGRSVKPWKDARRLREIAKDADKNRSDGLHMNSFKSMATDYILREASDGTDAAGNPILSGEKLRGMLRDKNTRRTFNEMLPPEQVDRLKQLADELWQVEQQRRISGGGQFSIEGMDKNAFVVGGRMASAAAARRISNTLQAPQMASSIVGQFMTKFLGANAHDVVKEALLDKELFLDLMLDTQKVSAPKQEKIMRRLISRFGQAGSSGAYGAGAAMVTGE